MNEKVSVPGIFGINVFNDAMMREHLPKQVYQELKNTIERGEMLNSSIADIIANAMKDWAIERGGVASPRMRPEREAPPPFRRCRAPDSHSKRTINKLQS